MRNNDTTLEDRILSVVTEAYDVPLKDIFRQTRKKKIAEARQVVAYCLRLMTDETFPAIGQMLGGRDHSTIIHSCSKIAGKIETNQQFRSKLDGILEAIIVPAETVEQEENDEEIFEPESTVDETKVQSETVDEPHVQYDIPTENLELTQREENILGKYRNGMTLQEIGDEMKVTRERVRQIVTKALLKQVGVKASEGFEIDVKEYIKGVKLAHGLSRKTVPEEERGRLLDNYLLLAANYTSASNFAKDVGIPTPKFMRSFPEVVNVIEKNMKERKARWSHYYTKCRGCGTIRIPHIRKGFCQACIGQYRGDRREALLGDGSVCAVCSMDRKTVLQKYGRDLFITRDKRVLCRGCFLQLTGRMLAQSRSRRA